MELSRRGRSGPVLSSPEPQALAAFPPVDIHAPLAPWVPDECRTRALVHVDGERQRCGRRRQLAALYAEGISLESIARDLGYKNAKTVSSTLYDMGIPPRTKGPQA